MVKTDFEQIKNKMEVVVLGNMVIGNEKPLVVFYDLRVHMEDLLISASRLV